MPIGINGVGNGAPLPPITQQVPQPGADEGSFQDVLSGALSSLSKVQAEAESSAAQLISGQPVELHEVLLATERASISFQLVVQARNKVVEAYQDVMRMQV